MLRQQEAGEKRKVRKQNEAFEMSCVVGEAPGG